MDSMEWKGRWSEIKGRIKQAYANVTDDDLRYQEGKEEEMLGRLEKRTGKTRGALTQWLNAL